MAELFVRLLVAHLVADFFLQSEYMAENKTNVKLLAGYAHAFWHWCCYILVTYDLQQGPWLSVGIAVIHWFIDLRFPLTWWRTIAGQSQEQPYWAPLEGKNLLVKNFIFQQDQAAHIIVLGIASMVATR